MTRTFKNHPGILNLLYRLNFPEEDVFFTPGLLISKTRPLKNHPGLLNFSS